MAVLKIQGYDYTMDGLNGSGLKVPLSAMELGIKRFDFVTGNGRKYVQATSAAVSPIGLVIGAGYVDTRTVTAISEPLAVTREIVLRVDNEIDAGLPIYIGSDGNLTEVKPGSGYDSVIGHSINEPGQYSAAAKTKKIYIKF